jgi:integrase
VTGLEPATSGATTQATIFTSNYLPIQNTYKISHLEITDFLLTSRFLPILSICRLEIGLEKVISGFKPNGHWVSGRMKMKRYKTDYPGVFFRDADRIGGKGKERVYYIVFKKDGKLLEEKAGRQYADDMTPARAARIRGERIEGKRSSRKELKQQQEEQKKAEESRWTIGKLWNEYKTGNPNLKGLQIDQYRYQKFIEPPLHEKEPKDLVPLDVDRIRIRLLKTNKPKTVENVLELLRRIIKFGEKKQLCEGLKFIIEMPKVNNLKTEDLSPEELYRLIEAIEEDPHIHAANMMRMALFTGMRRGELFKLKWDHIDFDRGFIHIIDPKGGPDQKIPLNDAARVLLLNHPRSNSQYVFYGRDGNQRTGIRNQVNRIKQRACLPKDFRPLHGLRHVYASMLASSGEVDLFTLQKLLTHKSPMMTQRYAHLRDETLKKASSLAGELIQQATNGKRERNAFNLTVVE